MEEISLKIGDGDCRAYVFTPAGEGPWPGVIFYMDAFGIRPGMQQMAQTVADFGYVVLMPDLYWRLGPYEALDPAEVLKGDFRAVVGPRMASIDNHKTGADSAAFLAYLDSRPDVKGDKVGTVGFCMGGGMAVTTAALYPDRVAAAVSFHGGNLASDLPVSPHLLADKIKAGLYVAVADKDGSYPPEMAEKFEAALNAAGVRYESEFYEGKLHGWMKPDMPVYDAEAADRGWSKMAALFARTLG